MDFSEYGAPSAEWREYARTHDLGPSDPPPDQTVVELRDATNAERDLVSAAFMRDSGLDKKVTWEDHHAPARDGSQIPIRIYRRADRDANEILPAYISYHGGGFLFGSVASEDAACARIVADAAAAAAGASVPALAVLSVAYRHTPDFTYPAQHDDAWDAFAWIQTHARALNLDAGRLVVGGVSAGANLACAVALQDATERATTSSSTTSTTTSSSPSSPPPPSSTTAPAPIRGQVLFIPWLMHRDVFPLDRLASPERHSYQQCADAPVLPLRRLDLFTDLLACAAPRDPRVSPGIAPDAHLARLPKTTLVVAGNDPLRDDGLLLASRLKALDVPAHVHVFPGLPHGFRRFADLSSSARWDQLLVEGIMWALDGGSSGASEDWKVEMPPYGSV